MVPSILRWHPIDRGEYRRAGNLLEGPVDGRVEEGNDRAIVLVLESFIIIPVIIGLGASWVTAATRGPAISRRSPLLAWTLVVMLAVVPLATLSSLWPLRLAFFISEPALDQLADRIVAGRSPVFPRWAGVFWVVNSVTEPATGNIGLIIDPHPSGRSGLVRLGAGSFDPLGPLYPFPPPEHLGGRWWYEEEY